jgi:hypothetical protein
VQSFVAFQKNVVTLENYYFSEDLRNAISGFVEYYNNQRYHESLNNLTPADVFYGRSKEIFSMREFIKKQTLQLRRIQNLKEKIINPVLDYEECLS